MGRRPSAAVLVALAVVARRVRRRRSGSVVLRHETDRIDRLDAVRQRSSAASLSVPLDYAHPNGPHITLALARLPAAGKRDRRAVHESRAARAGPASTSSASAADVFPAEIRELVRPRVVGSARRRRERAGASALDDLDAFYAVDHDPTTAAGVAQNVAAAQAFVDACEQQQRGDCCRTCRPRPTRARPRRDPRRDGRGADQLRRLLVRHAARRAVRRRVPEARAGDGARRRGRSRPLVRATRRSTRPRASTHDLDAFFAYCRDRPELRVRARRRPGARRSTTSRATIAAGADPGTVDGEHAHARPGRVRHRRRERVVRGRRRLRRPSPPRSRRRRAATATSMLALVRRVHRPHDGREVLERDRGVLRDRLHRRARRRTTVAAVQQLADARRARRAALRRVDRVARAAVHVLAGAGGGQGRADPRARRAADRRRRHDARPGDAVRVGAVARVASCDSGHLLTADGDEPHVVRPRQRSASTATSTATCSTLAVPQPAHARAT